MVKAKYYSQLNSIPPFECYPVGGIYPEKYAAAITAIADNDPAFVGWRQEQLRQTIIAELSTTDTSTVRVIEDIWEVLRSRGLVSDADLPVMTKAKLDRRLELRMKIAASDGITAEEESFWSTNTMWTTIKSWFGL